jgi:hypothetical protein
LDRPKRKTILGKREVHLERPLKDYSIFVPLKDQEAIEQGDPPGDSPVALCILNEVATHRGESWKKVLKLEMTENRLHSL